MLDQAVGLLEGVEAEGDALQWLALTLVATLAITWDYTRDVASE